MTLEALFDSTSGSGVDTFFGTRASYSKAWQAVEGEGKGQNEYWRIEHASRLLLTNTYSDSLSNFSEQ